jgi:hypothetical protein
VIAWQRLLRTLAHEKKRKIIKKKKKKKKSHSRQIAPVRADARQCANESNGFESAYVHHTTARAAAPANITQSSNSP